MKSESCQKRNVYKDQTRILIVRFKRTHHPDINKTSEYALTFKISNSLDKQIFGKISL
jgi:hypothetical protein